jgi:hypothetical protein
VDNIEQSCSQYFTICKHGSNEEALKRVFEAMKTYPRSSRLDEACKVFQYVYDQTSGNSVKNGRNKRKTVDESIEEPSAKRVNTEAVIPVFLPINQHSSLIQESHMISHLPFEIPINLMPLLDMSAQLYRTFCLDDRLPTQQQLASECNTAALFNDPTRHLFNDPTRLGPFFGEGKKPDVPTVAESKDTDIEEPLDVDAILCSNMRNIESTENEAINQEEHSSAFQGSFDDFFFGEFTTSNDY